MNRRSLALRRHFVRRAFDIAQKRTPSASMITRDVPAPAHGAMLGFAAAMTCLAVFKTGCLTVDHTQPLLRRGDVGDAAMPPA